MIFQYLRPDAPVSAVPQLIYTGASLDWFTVHGTVEGQYATVVGVFYNPSRLGYITKFDPVNENIENTGKYDGQSKSSKPHQDFRFLVHPSLICVFHLYKN